MGNEDREVSGGEAAMKLGYTILYVASVQEAIRFYGEAFGLKVRFVHESGDYAELETGETTLAFASHGVGEMNFPEGFVKLSDLPKPAGVEIALVTDDVPGAMQRAVIAGGTVLVEPAVKPWGQTVGYVRGPEGMLIELCTPVRE